MTSRAEIGPIAHQTAGDGSRIWNETAAQTKHIGFARITLRRSALLGVGSSGREDKQAGDGAGYNISNCVLGHIASLGGHVKYSKCCAWWDFTMRR